MIELYTKTNNSSGETDCNYHDLNDLIDLFSITDLI